MVLQAFEKAVTEIAKQGPAGLQTSIAGSSKDRRFSSGRREGVRCTPLPDGSESAGSSPDRRSGRPPVSRPVWRQLAHRASQRESTATRCDGRARIDRDCGQCCRPPERARAREFWATRTSPDPALCDTCGKVLARGDGYLETGRRDRSLGIEIELGDELVCERCFNVRRACRR